MGQLSLFNGEEEYLESNETVYSAYLGNNSDIIQKAMKLYGEYGNDVIDVTYGKGTFWHKVDTTKYNFIGTDLLTGVDFNDLPYSNSSKDIHVLDPPYGRNNTIGLVDAYQITNLITHQDILDMYRSSMVEGYRVLKKGGYSFVKCQDEVYGRKNYFTHIEVMRIAEEIGYKIKDMFIIVSYLKYSTKYDQQHARKNHSYLWIFEKTKK